MGLTAGERETIIVTTDADDCWYVSTSQRPWVTKLLKNKSATITRDSTFEGTRMVEGTIPKNGITIRTTGGAKRKTSSTTTKKRGYFTAAKCSGNKLDGSKCNSVAKGDTGYCFAHQDQKK